MDATKVTSSQFCLPTEIKTGKSSVDIRGAQLPKSGRSQSHTE